MWCAYITRVHGSAPRCHLETPLTNHNSDFRIKLTVSPPWTQHCRRCYASLELRFCTIDPLACRFPLDSNADLPLMQNSFDFSFRSIHHLHPLCIRRSHAVLAPQPLGPVLRPCSQYIGRDGTNSDRTEVSHLLLNRAHPSRKGGLVSRRSAYAWA
jgi:hypothetical protein